MPVKTENDTMTTMTKAAVGLALILATASGALAAGHKNTSGTNIGPRSESAATVSVWPYDASQRR
jgi:hypothetical protein